MYENWNDIQFELIGMISYRFKDRAKEHLEDLKYNQSAVTLLRINQKQNIEIYLEEARIIFPLKITMG